MKKMNCIFTGREVEYTDSRDTVNYSLEINGYSADIFICQSCSRKIESKHDFYIVESLIANGKWPQRSYVRGSACTKENHINNSATIIFPDFLKTYSYPRTPSQKMDNLLLNLFKLQKIDGEVLEINLVESNFWITNFFRSSDESLFYINGLNQNGLITSHVSNKDVRNISVTITHSGLSKVVDLLDDGDNSSNCFIAMAFTEEMKPYREAIKKALNSTGFNPVIIDEVDLDSDKTIPDGILSGIKQSKFCVADFTHHRNGVYFESGYALGLGKPVIYLCRADEFENAHFDIKQLQHIIYSTPEELEVQLSRKIEVWIKK